MPIKIIIKALVVCGIGLSVPNAYALTTITEGNSIVSLFGSSYAVRNGMALAEDDIILGIAPPPGQMLQAARGIGLNGGFGLWTNGLVPYEISPDLTGELRSTIQAAIDHWNTSSTITLVERSSLGANPPADYVDFISGPGCASWVGKQGGNQAVWVSSNCTTGSVIHEIGHALGLLHEHTRSDRDQYVNVQLENVQAGKAFNFDIVDAGTRLLGAYDYGSVMHYGEYFFSSNGQPTLLPFAAPEGVSVGQRVAASIGDLSGIDQMYGTDLSLVSDFTLAEDGQSTELQILVTNGGVMGAHNLQVVVPAGQTALAYGSNGDWSCQQDSAEIRCSMVGLNAGASSQLVLTLPGNVDGTDTSPGLASKTFDTNSANNGSSVATSGEPQLGQALTEDAVNFAAAGAGGGGSAGAPLLVFGLLASLRGRRK